MYRSLLVPLDGSAFGEHALPLALDIARRADATLREIMTPVVFSVQPETRAARVVAEMLAMKVHRLFVVDDSGVLVGVISAVDVLRHLRE